MEDIQGSALEAGAEAIVETPKVETTESQVEGQVPEGEEPKEKTERQLKREKEKAYRAQLKVERDDAKAEAERANARRQALLDVAKQSAPPKEEDFPDPIEYAVAKGIWGTRQEDREREAKNAGDAAKAAEDRAEDISKKERAILEQSWAVARDEAKSRYADFETVALTGWEPSPVMTDLILTSDVGADVAYHLGQNHALAAQIAAMNPVEAARAIGRIEAGIVQPKPRTETKAPDPISPVRGSTAASRNPENMSYTDWVKWREGGGKIT